MILKAQRAELIFGTTVGAGEFSHAQILNANGAIGQRGKMNLREFAA
jgi:hypothetical protein